MMKADGILNERASEPPPLDTVLLWLTATVERDFDERSAFPRLRRAHAKAYRGAAALHYLSPDEAALVLEDATARARSVRRGVLAAYTAHIKTVQAAMSEATNRPAVFGAPGAVAIHQSCSSERWRGTKDQLKAHGIRLDGPWPNEPGGKVRSTHARDSRGYWANITRFSTVWPGLYEAYISIPCEAMRSKGDEKAKADEADLARRNLASMPGSAEDFRAHLVDSIRMMARISLDMAVKPATYHGYTLDEDAVGEIHASFDAVVEAVVGAAVKFDPARHAAIAQQYRARIAAADQSFQAQFETMMRPNPRILEGGAQ